MLTLPLKIIVAEDDELQQFYLCGLINGLGYEAVPAQDGVSALELLTQTDAQIVISDLQMPNLDGIGLTHKIRGLDLEHYIHIIMVTGAEDDDVRTASLLAGVDDFITKGSGPAMLKARIRTATRLINHATELAERTRILEVYNARIQEDLRAAATAQRQLLPDLKKDIMGFRVASAFVPSSIVSGDMFGCFALCDDKLGFYAVDVSGHGVHAALLSVAIGHLVTPAYFITKAFDSSGTPDLAAMVAGLNTRFGASENDDYFTMFCGVVDKISGRLDYCQAGYPSPSYVDQSGTAEAIGDGGFPVGMISGVAYENKVHQFEIGGALIICSDAASEAENPKSEPFGNDRLRNIAETLPQVSVEKFPTNLVCALNVWRDGEPLEDDLTVFALERKNTHDTQNFA
ncbi:putative response regulator [Octadecabacter antarcticus 307]|uniref:Putative response regulator n=1 Tax=Octadecabacter antarcticus 307 TaxID=391626 RepID=M9RB51_9RHOB|nr:SpoIIE family protein phosphatase [Octadecabacter antarcticus]AGI67020.1 putative response regulator [Octadecabacter antarcticus 307]